MNKPLLLSILFLLLCIDPTCAQFHFAKKGIQQTVKAEHRDTVEKQQTYLLIQGTFIENDTLFFTQEFIKDSEDKDFVRNTSIYLEPDKESVYYSPDYCRSILDDICNGYSFEGWSEWRMEKKLPPLRRVNTFGLPTDWVSLHFYKGIPFVYSSCVAQSMYRINDSIMIYQSMEPTFASLSKSEKLSDRTYHLTLKDWSYSTDTVELYIHILDEKTRTAVWEYRYPDETIYRLLTPVESIPQFDLIVCNALYVQYFEKEQELFDKIDAKALLEDVKSGKRTTLFDN